MRAHSIETLDGPDAMRLKEIANPVPSEDDVLIEVASAGVAFPDLLYSYGQYQDKKAAPFVPGVEVSGVVLSAPAFSTFKAGDRVMAATWFGGFAEQAIARTAFTYPLPSRFTFAQGAGFVLNYQTAYFCLVTRGRLEVGETVLIHGAAGGVGVAAIQVIKALGATPIALVSSEQKAEVARKAGAQHAIVVSEGWSREVGELTGGRGVDMVFDTVGGDRLKESLRSMRRTGRYVVVGFADGHIPTVRLNQLLLRNIDFVGAAWGPFVQASPEVAVEIGSALHDMAEAGHLDPVVGPRFALSEAPDALRALENRTAFGKVVLDIVEPDHQVLETT